MHGSEAHVRGALVVGIEECRSIITAAPGSGGVPSSTAR